MSKYKSYIFLAVAFGVIVIVSTYLTTRVIQSRLNHNLIANYENYEQVGSNLIASTLEAEIKSLIAQLIIMSEYPEIKSGGVNCAPHIRDLLAKTGSRLGNVGRVDANGVFVCSLNAALVGRKAAELGSYITDIFNDPEHHTVMSRAIIVPNVEGYVTAVHIPVWTPDGKFDGTLGGAIYLKDLEEKYLRDFTFAQRGFVILLDDDGTILYHNDSRLIGTNVNSPTFAEIVGDEKAFNYILDEAKLAKSGVFEYQHNTEGLKVAGYHPVEVVPGRTWMVLVTMPVGDVAQELSGIGVNNLLRFVWMLCALIVVLTCMGFILAMQKFVFKPIQEVQEMKSDFVSLVSHQLKTPVAQIKGYTENMLDGLTGPLTDKQREYLSDMLNVAGKNSNLIDDLLNVSRIERRMLKVNVVSLAFVPLINDVLSPLRDVAKKKGVELVERLSNDSVSVQGDDVKTREALRNIVDNAIKFTDQGKRVTVETVREGDYMKVSISDEGPGVDPDVQTEIFEKNRVWAGKVKSSGAGLGLYLSKQFLELTGGSIAFATAPGKGTTFTVKLPISK
jgi:signal transduction histidine kinase